MIIYERKHLNSSFEFLLQSRGGPRRPRNDRSRSQGRQGKNNQTGPKDQGNQGQKNEKSAPRNQGQRGQQKGGNQQQGQQGGRKNRGGPNRDKDQGPPRRERNRTSSSSSAGKGEESPDGSPKKNRSQRRREQYMRRQFDRNGAENGDEKQEPRDAKPTDKDSQSKASDSNDITNNSKPKSSTDDAKPLVNGTPAILPETKVEHENGHDNESNSNSKPERPKELNVTQNGPKVEKEKEKVVNNHIAVEDNSVDQKDQVIPNGDVHIKDEPIKDEIHNCKSNSDKPIMNGGLSSGGEVSPSEPVKESGDTALPQRQPRERRERQKGAAEVVKEVTAMNGVVATGDDETVVDH